MKTPDRLLAELRFCLERGQDGTALVGLREALAEPLEVLRRVLRICRDATGACQWCRSRTGHEAYCVMARAEALLSGAPSPEPQPTAEQVAEAVRKAIAASMTDGTSLPHRHHGLREYIARFPLAPILKQLGVKT